MQIVDRLQQFEDMEMSIEVELAPCWTTVREALAIAPGVFLPLDTNGTPRCLLRSGGATLGIAELENGEGPLRARVARIGGLARS